MVESGGAWTDPRVVAALVAATISFIGLLISFWFGHRNRKISESSVGIAKFNLAQSQRKMLFDWASACQDALSLAMICCASQEIDEIEARKGILNAMVDLSALIDKGRWILPNKDHDWFGIDKEEAYRGFRDSALDHLVTAYNALQKVIGISTYDGGAIDASAHSRLRFAAHAISEAPPAGISVAANIAAVKREFTSEIQRKLQPRNAGDDFDRLVKQ